MLGRKWEPVEGIRAFMLLTGTYVRICDEKQRITLPKPIRDALGATSRGPTSQETVQEGLYLAPGTDRSLNLYPEAAFSQLAQQLAAASPNTLEVRAFSRLFYSQAQRVEIDRQSRIRIPAELAQLAQLQKELVLLGVRDHLELWNRTHWEEYLQNQQAHFDEIAERAFARRAQSDFKLGTAWSAGAAVEGVSEASSTADVAGDSASPHRPR